MLSFLYFHWLFPLSARETSSGNLHGKGLTPRANTGDRGSIWWALEITLITALPKLKLSCSILFYCYFYNIKRILLVKRGAVLIPKVIGDKRSWVSREASFPWISPLLSLLPPTTSLLPYGVEDFIVGCAPSNTVHLYPTRLLASSSQSVRNRVLQSRDPDRNFPSLFIWPHMTSHRQSQLRRQFAYSQFSIIWKSHKIEYNCG